MIATLQARPNPYVGPRAFQQGEKLYGRDLEVMQLLHLLMAERIVLFYSPSGAGKTSLIQAALILRLEEEGFHVLPSMRVSLDLPADEQADTFSNRYVFSLLLSLEEALPPEQRTPLAELSTLALGEYLDRRQDGGAAGTVLIFDQFEEILTLDPLDRGLKLEFFAQVGAALRDRRRWALFAMREEFIAGLEDVYLRPIPTRLRTSYRLGLLALQSARQAVQEPAKAGGVTFTDAAAGKLVRDLSTVQVLQPDGSTEKRPGPYVEPVQLQVVCRRLWDLLPEGASQIAEEDIGRLADVDLALSGYYDDQVKAALYGYYADQMKAANSLPTRLGVYFRRAVAAAEDIGVPALDAAVAERTVRNWFDRKLITQQGIRNQVLEGPEESEGLDNRAIRPLVDAHLVRAERRRGATWFELAHDRLIEPVQASNAAWRRHRRNRRIAVGATLIGILAIALALFVGWRVQLDAALATKMAAGTAQRAAEDTAVAAQETVAYLETKVTSCVTPMPTTPVPDPVPPVNHPPVANDDSGKTDQATAVTIDVVANDSDPECNLDPSSAKVTADPTNGRVINKGDGSFDYTPNADYNGPDGFVYEICDTSGLCDTAMVVITVAATNDPPVANDDSKKTDEATAVTIDVVANDSDPERNLDATSANTTCRSCSWPANGRLKNNGNGSFDYTPNADYNGPDGFVYEICDTSGLCDTAMVAITVDACSFEVLDPFAGLWSDYRIRLGCPHDPKLPFIQDAEQEFRNGRMFWRADNMWIYVVYERGGLRGTYQSFPDEWSEGDPYPCEISPPQGLFQPVRGFRVVWCGLGAEDAPIGWALAGERGFGPGNGDPLVQDFDRGLIFRDSERTTYVLFDDGKFVRVPH